MDPVLRDLQPKNALVYIDYITNFSPTIEQNYMKRELWYGKTCHSQPKGQLKKVQLCKGRSGCTRYKGVQIQIKYKTCQGIGNYIWFLGKLLKTALKKDGCK